MAPLGVEHRLFEELRADGQRFHQALLSRLPASVYILDLAKRSFSFATGQMLASLGFLPQGAGALLVHDSITSVVHPDDLGIAVAHLREVETWSDDHIDHFKLRLPSPDGGWQWMAFQEAVFNRDARGMHTHIVGVAQELANDKSQAGHALTLRKDSARLRAVIALQQEIATSKLVP